MQDWAMEDSAGWQVLQYSSSLPQSAIFSSSALLFLLLFLFLLVTTRLWQCLLLQMSFFSVECEQKRQLQGRMENEQLEKHAAQTQHGH